ncbi:MAG: type I 3-dehydroquinate dehydratase [Enterococcus sp.]
MIQVKQLVLEEGQPKICTSLIGTTREEILVQAQKAIDTKAVDLFEWRADFYEDVSDLSEVIETLRQLQNDFPDTPLLFTYRTDREGGHQPISLPDYASLCRDVVATGLIDLIDVELQQAENLGMHFVEMLKAQKVCVILSNHDFEETPPDSILLYRLNLMAHYGADIGKLAVSPTTAADVFRLMHFSAQSSDTVSLPIITIAMGELGKLSRVSGALTNSLVTFGSVGENSSAAGQIDVGILKKIMNELAIQPNTLE